MANIVTSARYFLRGTWVACILALAVITDPLAAAKRVGLAEPQTTWIIGEGGMRALFALAALLWMFVWFHGARMRFENQQPQAGDMPLHEVCRWIGRDSKWAAEVDPAWDDDWCRKVADELHSGISQFRIEVFGRPHLPKANRGRVPVIPAFKDDMQWEIHRLVNEVPPTLMWNPDKRLSVHAYESVKFDRRKIQQVWPKRDVWARWRQRSPIERYGNQHGGYEAIFRAQDEFYRANDEAANVTPARAMFGERYEMIVV